MKTRAILVTGPYRMELGEALIPDPEEGEALVCNRYTCISPGTELRTYSGVQEGKDRWPFIPGYAAVGVVEAVGKGVSIAPGEWVFHSGTKKSNRARVWGAHCGHAVTSAANLTRIPEGVDPLEASVSKLGAIALHGTRLSRPHTSETVVVLGLGPIGQLAARMHALCGARVVAADLEEPRVEMARQHGVKARKVAGTLKDTLVDLLPQGADIIVDATGSNRVLPEGIELAREVSWSEASGRASRYLLQGSYAGDVVFPYLPAFAKELSFLLPRGDLPEDLKKVLELLAAKRVSIRDLISAVRRPEEAEQSYADLMERRGDFMTVAFQWSS